MDEKKTYLINIESNLNKYAEEAVQAKKRVDELKTSNEQLKNSGTATATEIEASNSALRNAQTEYKKATKLVDLQTQANTSNVNSRKQLEAIVRIEQQRLGALANTITVNSKGQRVLTDEYKKQVKALADAKGAVIAYDQAQKDGRSNIGRYGESVSEAMKQVGTGMLSAIAPAALLAGAMDKLKEAFFDTEFGAKVQKKWTEGIKVFFKNLIKGNAQMAGAQALVAAEIAGKMEETRKGNRDDLIEIAKLQTEIDLLALKAADATKSEAEQEAYLVKLKEKENELIDYKKKDLQEELDNVNMMLAAHEGDSNTLLDEQARLMAEIVALEGERSLRVEKRLSTLRKKETDQIEKDKKALTELQTKIDENHLKELQAKEKAGVDEFKRLEENYNKGEELRKRDIEAGFEYQKLKNQNNIDALNTALDSEYAALLTSVEYSKMTNNEKLLADEQYTQAKKELSMLRIEQSEFEKYAISEAFGAMSDAIGKQTAVGKMFAIAQATMDTYVAANKALVDPSIPSTIARIAMMTAIIARGIANVKQIMAVNPRGGNAIKSAPTSISSAPQAQRITATQVGSTVLTQPQLSQSQLNAIPQQGQLTVEQLVEAFKKLPAPVTTIEDINAKTKSTNKIVSRANI